VHPDSVVVVVEAIELCLMVAGIPEQDAIEVLASNVPMSRSTSGCEHGMNGTVLTIEHPTHGDAIDVSRLDRKANNATREQVHHDADPITLEQYRLTAKQVETPEPIFQLTDNAQP
jgi:hypothetical protein